MKYYLAIDIGASSGRHIIGYLDNGVMKLEEIYRFKNGIKEENGFLVWDVEHIFKEIKNGLKECKKCGKIPDTVAIDTWGVDYVLLDGYKKEILPCVSYRDSRTFDVPEEVDKIISRNKLYEITGIQATNYNTIYQLFCDKKTGKLDNAKYCLMMPEYFSFKLTGKCMSEYTISTTGGLVNTKCMERDSELLEKLGIDKDIFIPLSAPGTMVGNLTEEVVKEIGFDTKVVFCASHDTASAVAACCVDNNGVYIASGTWSLIGTEVLRPIVCKQAMDFGFTNEGGVEKRFRFLKNIMGMWLFQNIRKNLNESVTYDEMIELAKNSEFKGYIDPNAKEFVAPENMIEAIKDYHNNPELTVGDVLNSAYHSLAKTYAESIKTIEEITDKTINVINIIGGGCQDKYLNSLVEKYTNKKVIAGPVEASAIGNIAVQLMYDDENHKLEDVRGIIKKSFTIK